MAITERVRRFLDDQGIAYELFAHREAFTAQEVAQASHVPGLQLAKVLVIRDGAGAHMLAVLPAPCRVDLHALEEASGRRKLALATETEASALFPDCERGAFPPFGNLYSLPVYVDRCFHEHEALVFQPGNHHEAVRMRFEDFERVTVPVMGEFCLHARDKRLTG